MATTIHPSAVVEPGATLGADCAIGPFCVVRASVTLGDRCRLHSHVALDGPSTFGPDNEFFPFCSIGGVTQDLKYRGEPTRLRVGAGNHFRECVTVNRGTGPEEETVIGSFNHLLAYAHVAHNCIVGDHCIFSNNGTLAGHVVMEDRAIISGLSAVHQFCRIGRMSIIGGCTKIVQDVPPYMLVDGNPAQLRAVNMVGLQRNGVPESDQAALKAAFKILANRSLNTSQAVDRIVAELESTDPIAHLVQFIQQSERGIIRT